MLERPYESGGEPPEVVRLGPCPKAPEISVVIPTFNRADALRQSLVALRSQTLESYEVLVVDNGPSTDHTRETVIAFAREDPRIAYVSTALQGDAFARNIGCELATGEVVVVTDDDWLMTDPEALTYVRDQFLSDARLGVLGLAHDYAAADPEAVSLASRARRTALRTFIRWGYKPTLITRWGTLRTRFRHIEAGRLLDVDHVRGYCMALRLSALRDINGFETGYVLRGHAYRGETEVCVRLALAGYRVALSTEVMGYHDARPRQKGVTGRGRFRPEAMYLQSRNNTLFFLRNFWTPGTAFLFRAVDLLWGSYRHPGLIRGLLHPRYAFKFRVLGASLRGKRDALRLYRAGPPAADAARTHSPPAFEPPLTSRDRLAPVAPLDS
ncbi:MAG: glycosyltransferase [Bacteroidota bacterium]